jgi:hypothetical protein
MRIWHLTKDVRLSPNSTENLLLALTVRLQRNANFEVALYLVDFMVVREGLEPSTSAL